MIPYYQPYYSWSELFSALHVGTGRSDFESALAAHAGARYGIAFAYARSGVIALLKALELTQTEVVLPAYTCEVMAAAIVASGNHPAFVDINLEDYNMDISQLKHALTARTRVVVATHLYGYPMDVNAIRAVVGDERVIILEDCAQRLFSPSPGTNELRGDVGLFSFGPQKPLCTVQGGAVVTNSSDLCQKIRTYRDREMNQFSARVWAKRWTWLLASYLVSWKWAYGLLYWYRHRAKPFDNVRLQKVLSSGTLPSDVAMAYTDFQARIGLAQLRSYEDTLAKRRVLAKLYDQELHDIPAICPAPLVDGATYCFYTLRVPRRDEIKFRKNMARRGVNVDQSYDYALPYLTQYQAFARDKYPRALRAAREVVNLPIYPGLGLADARIVTECVRRSVEDIS